MLEEWSGADHHKEMTRAGEMVARRSSAGFAPWVVILSGDDRYRDMAMGRTIEQAIRKRLDGDGTAPTLASPAIIATPGRRTALDGLDLSVAVAKAEYDQKLRSWQDRLRR